MKEYEEEKLIKKVIFDPLRIFANTFVLVSNHHVFGFSFSIVSFTFDFRCLRFLHSVGNVTQTCIIISVLGLFLFCSFGFLLDFVVIYCSYDLCTF